METLELHGKRFHIYLEEPHILARVKELAQAIGRDFSDKSPLFVSVLNGSFVFSADIMRQMNFPCEIQFVKISSYQGTQSTGKVQQLLGLNIPVKGRKLIILEDIIDSGLTIDFLKKEFEKLEPESVQICTLLLKPEALKVSLEVHYVGFEVENEFLVGYGLDYDGFGRNLPHLYQANHEPI